MRTLEIIEPTPSLFSELKDIPEYTKMLMRELIEYCKIKLVSKATTMIDEEKKIIMMNGMILALNNIDNYIEQSVDTTPKNVTSLVTRKKIQKR